MDEGYKVVDYGKRSGKEWFIRWDDGVEITFYVEGHYRRVLNEWLQYQ